MTKLEKMLNAYDKAQASVEGLKSEITRLEEDQARLDQEADTAAQAGDLSLYQAKRDEAKLATDTLFVRRKQLEKTSCVRSEQEAKEAWHEYAETYNKTFAKNWAAYMKAREALYNDFLALVHGQEAALAIREKCAACCDMAPDGISGSLFGSGLDSAFPMKLIPDNAPSFRQPQLNTPDTQFYLWAFGADLELFNRVIRLHRSR